MLNGRNLREHSTPSNRWFVLALLFSVRLSTGIQYQAVASLSPQLMSGFVLSIAEIGLLIGLYHAAGTILAFPGGAIGAWLGDKPVVLTGLALMAIGEIAAATAPSRPILMGARIVAGTGGILLNVMIIKMVADWFTSKETATAMAIIGSSAPAGIALALATIPWIASSGDRAPASISIVVYLVLALVALAAVYKAPDEVSAAAQNAPAESDQSIPRQSSPSHPSRQKEGKLAYSLQQRSGLGAKTAPQGSLLGAISLSWAPGPQPGRGAGRSAQGQARPCGQEAAQGCAKISRKGTLELNA